MHSHSRDQFVATILKAARFTRRIIRIINLGLALVFILWLVLASVGTTQAGVNANCPGQCVVTNCRGRASPLP